MSETLRDLVVSLSLQSDNFTRNIKSVNKQIQEAESYFKLASAGVEGFDSTTEGLSAELSMLERRLKLQKDAMNQYQQAMAAANAKLQECFSREGDYANRLDMARQRQAQLKDEVNRAAAKHREYADTLGETDSATLASKANLDALQQEYQQASAEVTKLSGQHEALKKSTQNAADAVSTAQTKYNGAQAAVKQTSAEIERCSQRLALSQTEWDAAGQKIAKSETALRTMGKQLQLAQSRFKLAATGVKDFDKSAAGLTAKLTLLHEKLELQKNELTEYESKLEAAKEQLEAAQEANDPDKVQEATDAVIDAETALNNARAAVKQTQAEIVSTNRELRTARSHWTSAGKSLEDFGKKCEMTGKAMTSVGRSLSTTITTPLLALGTAAIKAAVDYESAFTSVRKTVVATEAEFGQLSDSIKQMSTQVAASATDIAEVTAVAGQLGIQNDHLMEFTRTMIDLGNSTDIVADEAASTLAKFANIMSMDQSLFENLGSTLVDLGNNYATTESAIMEMSMRLAGAGHQVGLSEAQILGFATALSSVGIEAQMGGSAFSKALVKMEVASATGGQALEDFGAVAGMTGAQFKTLWDADPAAAFQSFIVGLSQMDDAGLSAIAVLDEIGIKEVRLRDTLLRATNATELFSATQVTATNAWQQNTALATESGKRYATMESRMTNLKNTAMLFAQTIGNDLTPMMNSLMSGAGDLLQDLMDMDEAQRLQIIKFAALAAAAGPVLLMMGKLTTGIGKIATGLGKFATAVGTAGGGFSGFMSVLASSPAVWIALAAAVTVGTIALVDYASGAKQAREALEGMKKTAQEWKDTAADTFYGSSQGLSFFGMTDADFKRESMSAQGWMDGIIALWTDGQKETNDVISAWTESWKGVTASTRTELQSLKDTADESGYTSVSDQLAADIATLDAMDSEIERLLKKKKNKKLTEKDKLRLQELIDTRDAIEVKYHLTEADTDAFSTIGEKVAAEIARAQARGQSDADVSVYENAMVAAAEGMATVNGQLDAQYDKEFAVIQLIEDSTERQAAMDELNRRYGEDRLAAAREYAATLAGVIMPVWDEADIQQAGTDIDTLTQKLAAYSAASESEKPALLQELNELTAGMDESAVTEYIALLTQVQSLLDSGMSQEEVQTMFPEIDFTTQLDQIAAIQTFLSGRETLLPGLSSMFGEALPEEMVKITTDLDMTGAQARWDEFAANPGSITTDAVITGFAAGEAAVPVQPVVTALISGYTEVPEGASTALLTPSGLLAYVAKYAEVTTGADVSGLTPEHLIAIVSGYAELASGTDVSLLKPDEITAYVSQYLADNEVDTTGLTPDGITATVMAYQEVTGGALTTTLTPTDIAAIVTKYLLDENVDLTNVTDPQVDAIVTAFAEAANCDKTALKAEVVATITSYEEAEDVVRPDFVTSQIAITGYDLTAYRAFVKDNPVEVAGVVRLGSAYADPSEALADPNTSFWQNGTEIPAELVPTEQLTADKVAVLAEDGTMHILLTPELTGSEEAVSALRKDVAETDALGVTELGKAFGLEPATLMDMVTAAVGRLKSYEKTKDYGWLQKFWATICGESTDKGTLDTSMQLDFSPDKLASLTTYVQEMVTAVQNGEQLSEQDLTNMQALVEFLDALELAGVGENVTAGIGEAMVAAGWDTDAESVATNLENALNTALDIHSPSVRMHPIGENAAAGIGAGFGNYDPTTDADTLAGRLEAALGTSIELTAVGTNAMAGLKDGIRSGQAGVVAAMRTAARAAVRAAKAELKIHSPSAVFRDDVGRMTMKGFGEGVLMESRAQAQAIRNASRFLTGEAKESAIAYNSSDNRQTYNQQSSVNLSGNTFYVRDDKDIYSLATEIATLTKRQQRGRGMRMA